MHHYQGLWCHTPQESCQPPVLKLEVCPAHHLSSGSSYQLVCGVTHTPPHPARVQARFTFLYKQVNGKWKIAEHHSSAMPEVQPAGVAEMFDRWNTALQVSSHTSDYWLEPDILSSVYLQERSAWPALLLALRQLPIAAGLSLAAGQGGGTVSAAHLTPLGAFECPLQKLRGKPLSRHKPCQTLTMRQYYMELVLKCHSGAPNKGCCLRGF